MKHNSLLDDFLLNSPPSSVPDDVIFVDSDENEEEEEDEDEEEELGIPGSKGVLTISTSYHVLAHQYRVECSFSEEIEYPDNSIPDAFKEEDGTVVLEFDSPPLTEKELARRAIKFALEYSRKEIIQYTGLSIFTHCQELVLEGMPMPYVTLYWAPRSPVREILTIHTDFAIHSDVYDSRNSFLGFTVGSKVHLTKRTAFYDEEYQLAFSALAFAALHIENHKLADVYDQIRLTTSSQDVVDWFNNRADDSISEGDEAVHEPYANRMHELLDGYPGKVVVLLDKDLLLKPSYMAQVLQTRLQNAVFKDALLLASDLMSGIIDYEDEEADPWPQVYTCSGNSKEDFDFPTITPNESCSYRSKRIIDGYEQEVEIEATFTVKVLSSKPKRFCQ